MIIRPELFLKHNQPTQNTSEYLQLIDNARVHWDNFIRTLGIDRISNATLTSNHSHQDLTQNVFSGLVLEIITSYLDFKDLFSLSQTSRRLQTALIQRIENRIRPCVRLSVSAELPIETNPLRRSSELVAFNPLLRKKRGRANDQMQLHPWNAETIAQIRHSGSMYAFTQPLKDSIGIQNMSDLRTLIDSLPDELRDQITGLDCKGFDMLDKDAIEDLRGVIDLCPELIKVQLYFADLHNDDQMNALEALNSEFNHVKIRISN